MGDRIFSIIWWGLMAWTCWKPNGFGPYILLGVNGGDFLITVWCGLTDGYLKEEGDLHLSRYLLSTLGFGLLGGFYVGKLSFQPGTDAYAYALYLIFASFWPTFGYRFFQYGYIRFAQRFGRG